MRILITGASGNIGKGLVPRLQALGHELALTDVNRLPDETCFVGIPFVQGDIQQGIGLDRAASGCDMIVHLPAWHGIHWGEKTEIDYWRLNVDGTFWMLQAAQAAGIFRIVYLSSLSWHNHYDKYGFTKRIGEELCEYNRQRHGTRFVAIRPADLTPWGQDFLRYGARLLYGGVDREDVLDCIALSVQALVPPLADGTETEGFSVDAIRADPYTAEQLEGWTDDPAAACERIFPGSREFVEKYDLDIARRPSVFAATETGARIGYHPSRHFGTFLQQLREIDQAGGEAAVRAMACPY